MAVALPFAGFSELDLPFDLGIAHARTRGGLVVTSRPVDPVMRGRMTTGPLAREAHQRVAAFLTDCVDRHLRVDFIHPRHQVPIYYTPSNLPFDGLGDVTDFPDLRTVRASGLYVGLVLKRGDRIGLEQAGMKLCRWIRDDLVVSSATAQDLPLVPRLPIGVFTAGAVTRLKDPVLRFMVVPGSIDAVERYEETPISWDIEEVLI